MCACINFFINDFIIVLLCCVDHEFLSQNNLFWVPVLSYSWPLSFGKLVWLFKQNDQIMKSLSIFFNNWNKFLISEIPYLLYSFMFAFNNFKTLFIFHSLRILYMQIMYIDQFYDFNLPRLPTSQPLKSVAVTQFCLCVHWCRTIHWRMGSFTEDSRNFP